MAENLDAPGPLRTEPASVYVRRQRQRGVFRRFVFPLAVLAAIAAVIWWLEYRPDSGPASGERYGPVSLPAALTAPAAKIAPKEAALAPDFLLERLDGGELRLSGFRGRPVVLNFWATWCAPCRKEIPQLVEAYRRFKGRGLVIIAVNLQEGKSIVRPYAEDFGIDFPIAIDRDGEVGDEYRLLGLPTTFFIDAQGVIRSVFMGPFLERSRGTNVQAAIESSELEKRIAQIMVGPAGRAAGE